MDAAESIQSEYNAHSIRISAFVWTHLLRAGVLFVVAIFVSGHTCIHHHPAQGKESASSKIALSVTTLQRWASELLLRRTVQT